MSMDEKWTADAQGQEWLRSLDPAVLHDLLKVSVVPEENKIAEAFPELSTAQVKTLGRMLAGEKSSFESVEVALDTPPLEIPDLEIPEPEIAELVHAEFSAPVKPQPETEPTSKDPTPALDDAAAFHNPFKPSVNAVGLSSFEPNAQATVSAADDVTEDGESEDRTKTVTDEKEQSTSSSAKQDKWNFDEVLEGESALPEVNPQDFVPVPIERIPTYKFKTGVEPLSYVETKLEGLVDSVVVSAEKEDQEEEHELSVFIHWEPYDTADEFVLYRVVASDYEEKLTPEAGDTLEFTEGTAYRDYLPKNVGLRIYRVWVYSGGDKFECIQSQPKLVGEKNVVVPPHDFKVLETNGTVTGTWSQLKGHESFKLFVRDVQENRPMDHLENELRGVIDQRGFTYSNLVRGKTYDFQLFPVVQYLGKETRGAGSQIIRRTISADIQSIKITKAVPIKDSEGVITQIVLDWIAPPTGEVRIYLTNEEPGAAIIDEVVLPSDVDENLDTEWSFSYDGHKPGETVTQTFSWPEDWSRVYCVPVNVVGEEAMVGNFRVVNRVDRIEKFTFHERVSNQLVTFDWPKGASFVVVSDEQDRFIAELVHEDYRRQGGVRLQLDAKRAKFHLTPKSVYSGITTQAQPTTIEYLGRRVYEYSIKRNSVTKDLNILVWRRDTEDIHPPSFCLVHNPERLPLYARDGNWMHVHQQQGNVRDPEAEKQLTFEELKASEERARTEQNGVSWVVDSKDIVPGYIRLFINPADVSQDSNQIVIDPQDVGSLIIRPEIEATS